LPANAYAGTEEKGSRPISRVLSWTIIPLGHPSPDASSSLPGSHARTPRCRFPCDFPIWPCSRRGLPCHNRYQLRGALLPHHFTLTCGPSHAGSLRIGGIFPVALSVGSRPPGVTWRRVRRSPDFPPHLVKNAAIVWPTPRVTIRADDTDHKCASARSGVQGLSAAPWRARPRAHTPPRARGRSRPPQSPPPWRPANAQALRAAHVP
jgi:hypothetical protein